MTNIAESERFECRICHAESSWDQGFVDVRSVWYGPHKVCIGCVNYQRKYSRFYRRILLWILAAAIGGRAILGSMSTGLIELAVVYVSLYLSVILHELGHALVARLVGFRVLAFSIGGGFRTNVFRWDDSFVIIGPSPTEGLIVHAADTPKLYRTKSAAVTLAGPMANIVGFVVGPIALGSLSDATPDFLERFLVIWTIVNLFMMANLIPMEIETSFGAISSDGRQLLRLRKLSNDDVADALARAPVVYAQLAFWYGSYELAFQQIEHGIATGSLTPGGRILATAVLIELGRVQESIELSRKYLQSADLEPHERALLQNNLAFALIMNGKANLTEADELSSAATEYLPMIASILGTRGMVLVEKGEHLEAIELLTDRRHQLSSRSSRATINSYLAIAWAHSGDMNSATNALERAQRLEPGNNFLGQAKHRVRQISYQDAAVV